MWPTVSYEEIAWHIDPDTRMLLPKSVRRKITPTYQAAVLPRIAQERLRIPEELSARITDLLMKMVRFDGTQVARGYNLPALLLRSESAASSQIEHLTSSVRNVAIAELSGDAPLNARIVQGSLDAMREALAVPGEFSVPLILAIHKELIKPTGASFGGKLRTEQVWVGGTAYSPHGALYVPPAPERVAECLDDFAVFANRDDVNAVAKAAIAHAQFESIHPFIDGNGRTGRALLHRMLRQDGVLTTSALPVSAGLLHDTDAYMAAIDAYQQGDPEKIIECVTSALELALIVGGRLARDIDVLMEEWKSAMTERSGSAIWRLPALLAEQPVVSVAYVAEHLGITQRAAQTLIARACEYGILRHLGSKRRGDLYQSDALIELLEEISSEPGIRRVLAR